MLLLCPLKLYAKAGEKISPGRFVFSIETKAKRKEKDDESYDCSSHNFSRHLSPDRENRDFRSKTAMLYNSGGSHERTDTSAMRRARSGSDRGRPPGVPPLLVARRKPLHTIIHPLHDDGDDRVHRVRAPVLPALLLPLGLGRSGIHRGNPDALRIRGGHR